jgi:hypothetical protein
MCHVSNCLSLWLGSQKSTAPPVIRQHLGLGKGGSNSNRDRERCQKMLVVTATKHTLTNTTDIKRPKEAMKHLGENPAVPVLQHDLHVLSDEIQGRTESQKSVSFCIARRALTWLNSYIVGPSCDPRGPYVGQQPQKKTQATHKVRSPPCSQ